MDNYGYCPISVATIEGSLTMCSSDEKTVTSQLSAINDQQPTAGEEPTTVEEPTTDLNPTTDEKPTTDERAATEETPTTCGNPPAADEPPADDQQSPPSHSAEKQRQYPGPLRRKGDLMPQISQLALEGHAAGDRRKASGSARRPSVAG